MVAIYAIAKNEAEHVERFMENAHEADHVVVVVSDESTDGTADLLRQHGATVHVRPDPKPWRFDEARNIALSLVPENVDCCVSLDLDESLEPGWHKALEKTWETGARWISYRYICPLRKEGAGPHQLVSPESTEITCSRTKAHARHGFRWMQPVHEKVVPDDPNTIHAYCPDMVVLHHRQHMVDYIDMLTEMIETDPINPDAYIQRGHDYMAFERWEEAERDYLTMLEQTNGMTDDHTRCKRAWAWICVGQSRHKLGRPVYEVLDALLSAVASHPGLREPWIYLAEAMLGAGNAPLAYGAAMTGMSITDHGPYPRDANCWGDLPKQIASAAYSALERRA